MLLFLLLNRYKKNTVHLYHHHQHDHKHMIAIIIITIKNIVIVIISTQKVPTINKWISSLTTSS